MKSIFEKLFARKSLMGAGKRKAVRTPIRTRPLLEHLEDRLAPSVTPVPTYEWTGKGGDNLWSDGANWTNGGPASAGAGNHVDLVFHTNTLQEASSVDDIPSLPLTDSITFDANNFSDPTAVGYNAGGTDTAGGYTFTGAGSITLDAAAGIKLATGLNPSGVTETFNGPSLTTSVAQTWTITDSVETLALTANSNLNLGGNVLTVAGAGTLSLRGVVSGAAGSGFTIPGTATLILAGANTYQGTTNIAGAGFILVQSNTGLGNAANTENVAGGGVLFLQDGASPTMTGTLTLDNGGLAGQSVTNTWTGPIALASSNAIAAAGGGRFVINGVISTSAGTPSLFISGFGTTEFQVNNTYTGTTTVEANNTLQIDAPSGLGAGGAGNGTTIDNGGELDLNFTGSLQDAGANAEALTLNGNGSPFGTDLGALEVLAAHGVTIPGTVTLGSDATIGVGTGTLTFPATAVISGNFNLTYDEDAGGQGEIITQAANTYGGATTTTDIKSGVILNIQNNAGLGNASPTHTAIVEDGAALQTQGALGTIANNLQFNTTAAADFPTAATGSLEDVSGSTTFSGTVTLNNATTVQTQISVDTAGTANRLVLSGAIQGPGAVAGSGGGIIKAGAGILRENGGAGSANSYGGLTSVNDGLLELNKNANVIAVPGALVIGDNSPNPITVDSDIVQVNNNNEIATSVPVTINADGELLLNANQTVGPLTLTGGDIEGTGTLTLNGDVTATSFLDAAADFITAEIAAATLNLNLPFGGGTRTFTVNTAAGHTDGPPSFPVDLNVTSVIADGSSTAVNLLKAGTGEMDINNANTYTGATTISAGIFGVDGGTIGSNTGGGVSVASGASLVLFNNVSIAATKALTLNGPGFSSSVAALDGAFGGDAWNGTITLAGTAASTIGAQPGSTLTVTGSITGGTAGLIVQDGGLVVENGTTANNYGGATTVLGDTTLELDRINAGIPQLAIPTGSILTITDGTVQVDVGGPSGFEIPTDDTVNVGAAGDLNLQNGVQQTIAVLNGTAGGLVDLTSGAGTELDVTGAIGVTGAGTFAVNGDGNATAQFVTNGNTVTVASGSTLNLNVGLSGSGFTQSGGAVQLSGTAQNLETALTVNSGALLLAKTGPLAGAGLSIAVGGILTIGDGAGAPNSVVVRDIGSNWQLGGISTVGSGALVVVNSDGLLDINGKMDRIGDGAGNTLTMNGGTVSLGAGELFVDPNILVTANAVITGNGLGLNLDGAVGTFTVDGGANLTVSAPIINGGLTKAGAGSMTLTGANTYTGATTVSGGSLFVNDDQPQSAVTVQSGGTIAGNGTIGNLIVQSGGTVAPGATTGSPGILIVSGSATLQTGSTFNELIDGTTPGIGYGQLVATGTVAVQFGDTLNVTVNGAFPANTVFTIIQAGSTTGTFTTVNVTPPVPLVQFDNGSSVTLTISLASTTSAVSASYTGSPAPAVFEEPVTLTDVVTFAPGTTMTPSGTVQFFDGGTPIGSPQQVGPNFIAASDSATVFIVVPSLSVATHGITAVYSGDAQNATSSGGTTVTVDAAQTTLAFTTPPPASAFFEQPVTITAQVSVSPPSTGSPTTPTGFVTFTATPTVGSPITVAVVPLSGSLSASTSLSNLPPGSYTISAAYTSGDGNFTAPASPITASEVVSQAGTTTTLTSPTTTNSTFFGQTITVSASVAVQSPSTGSPTAPTGFIDFTATNMATLAVTDLGKVALNGSQASTTTNSLAPGTYTISASYLGDTNFSGSASAASPAQTVNAATTTVTLAAQPNPSGAGVAVTFTVTLANTSSSQPPVGSVEMFDGTTDLGPATFVGDTGATATYTFTTSSLKVGQHSIQAQYTSNGDFTGGPSNTVTEVVQPTIAAFVEGTDGSLRTVNPGAGLVNVPENPGPGSVSQISSVTANGQVVLFAIASNNDSLWEHTASGWTNLSPAEFTDISAATDVNGNAVCFGVLSASNPFGEPQNLVEFHAASDGFTNVSSGSISQVSAVGTPAGEVAYVIISQTVGNTGNANPSALTLWRYDAAKNPTGTVDHGFAQESSGSFSNISTGLTSGGSQAALYAVLTNNQLWEQNPNFGPVSLDSGFEMLSGSNGLTTSFLGVAAETHAVDKAFAVASDRTIYEVTPGSSSHLLLPAGSPGVAQISASETPVGTDELFAVLTDGELWEFQGGTGASPAGFTQLLTGGAAETSAP